MWVYDDTSDFGSVRELCRFLAEVDDDAECIFDDCHAYRPAMDAAMLLLQPHVWAAVERLADALVERGYVEEDEIRRITGITTRDAPTRVRCLPEAVQDLSAVASTLEFLAEGEERLYAGKARTLRRMIEQLNAAHAAAVRDCR